ncbi:hypothetical protein Tco_1208847, partial [Tanacetum coccineum]
MGGRSTLYCQGEELVLLVNTASLIFKEFAIPGQTATGKESSNPFMAGSLPKTIHFCDSLQSDEDSFELIELMILCTNFLTMGRIVDADAEVIFIDETSNNFKQQKMEDDKEKALEVKKCLDTSS